MANQFHLDIETIGKGMDSFMNLLKNVSLETEKILNGVEKILLTLQATKSLQQELEGMYFYYKSTLNMF